jgi:hypothetical protein
LLVNPRLALGQVADERTEVFRGMIGEYLDAITAKTHVEDAGYLANTRHMLDLTRRVVELGLPADPPVTPTPPVTPVPGAHRGYLPLVER